MTQNSFQHALERFGWSTQNQALTLLVPGLLIALIFAGMYLSQVASYATTNRQIEELIAQRDRLERQNEQLRGEIAALETMPRLLAHAEALGFRPATAADIEYYVIEGYNPNRSRTVVPPNAEDEFEQAIVYDETFSGWLQQQWDMLQQQFANFGG